MLVRKLDLGDSWGDCCPEDDEEEDGGVSFFCSNVCLMSATVFRADENIGRDRWAQMIRLICADW